jgi:putative transcriptional regulator
MSSGDNTFLTVLCFDNTTAKCYSCGMLSRMVKIKLKELLKDGNKSLYRLQKETDISYNALLKIRDGEVSAMSFDVLEKLCHSLDCTPNDLLIIESPKKQGK